MILRLVRVLLFQRSAQYSVWIHSLDQQFSNSGDQQLYLEKQVKSLTLTMRQKNEECEYLKKCLLRESNHKPNDMPKGLFSLILCFRFID
jgi:hypothetical protein